MFRPKDHTGPGDAITLELAWPTGAIEVSPIRGADELWLTGRRKPGIPPVALETLVLRAGVIRGGGDPEGWLIGDRNRAILAVLCAGFGAPNELWVRCPACDELHELPFDPGSILFKTASDLSCSTLSIRLPTGVELVASGGNASALRDCCAPGMSVEDVEAEIAAHDPCAELRFALTCVACDADFHGGLDPLALLLAELDRHGGVLAEIDALARAYHWAEADLLALPTWRRRLYLRQIADQPERIAS